MDQEGASPNSSSSSSSSTADISVLPRLLPDHVQSRNIRRKIQSIQQQHHDATAVVGRHCSVAFAFSADDAAGNHELVFEFSSTERYLRRRHSCIESIDVKLEAWPDTCDRAWLLQCYHVSTFLETLTSSYQHWMSHCCGNYFCVQVSRSMKIVSSVSEGSWQPLGLMVQHFKPTNYQIPFFGLLLASQRNCSRNQESRICLRR